MDALVTGGAGFIGSHITDALVAKGLDVGVMDNLSTGQAENVHTKAELFPCDIRSPEAAGVVSRETPGVLIHYEKTTDELGWTPEVSLEEGLRRTVEWFESHKMTPA